ncbi:CAP domain-containing protein [Streptomyces termitum]|uniref:CAP domain-containing protein n=1 Tax=Streptomyces termitum TaxID=67368 RepID=UPI00339FEB34
MQRTTDTDQTAEWIRAAQYGDPWACDRLLAAHRPLVQGLLLRALTGRPAADAATADTLRRAHASLHTLPSPESFRPWLVALAVDAALGRAAADPGAAAGWLDVQDALLAALGALEEEGQLLRYETAAALRWSPEDTALAVGTARDRLAAARSVAGALAHPRRCPGLHALTGGWDGRPAPAWRDHLAAHTTACGPCATGVHAPAPAFAAVPAAPSAGALGEEAYPPHPGAEAVWEQAYPPYPAAGAVREQAYFPHPVAGAVGEQAPDAYGPGDAYELGDAYDLGGPEAAGAGAGPADVRGGGRRGNRADLRRRRQERDRSKRRAAVAAGIAVVAVTGGVFALQPGRGEEELLEANGAAVPAAPDLPLSHSPDGRTGGPATAAPSAPAAAPASAPGAKAGKAAKPSPATATPTPAPTTASPAPAPKKTAAPTAAPRPTRTAEAPSKDTGAGTGSRRATADSSAAGQVIALVNAERAKAGCGPLTANATLTRAAQGHSDDMAARDFFDHTNPDGDGPGERVTAAGYPWTTYGENIAMGQTTPEQVMEGWMNSQGHRENILNCSFKEIGVGVQKDGGPYWTQVFGAR